MPYTTGSFTHSVVLSFLPQLTLLTDSSGSLSVSESVSHALSQPDARKGSLALEEKKRREKKIDLRNGAEKRFGSQGFCAIMCTYLLLPCESE
mmetsp:Transcript_41477/g.81833  ORF Transcript_41477/g.81833 Transcript_41477/m.81833 type:complete len:93 (+) Transcript_41477:257-535(+)